MKAIESFTRIQRALAILDKHPEGLRLDQLAAELEVDTATLRTEILQYYGTDIDPRHLMGLQRRDVIEFLSDVRPAEDPDSPPEENAEDAEDIEDIDPYEASVVRATSEVPAAELGVQYLRADQLAELYEAARSLADLEPDNEALASAVQRLSGSFLTRHEAEEHPDSTPALLRRAIDQQRAVRIEYSRGWEPGVSERVVHPYSLLRTRRGYELDAGPLDDGRARTFIVSRIRREEILDETFERPPGIVEILGEERSPTTVELSLPQGTRWVVDRYAEHTTVVADDSDDLSVRAEFLPPVADRVGLVLLIAGPNAFVVAPQRFEGAGEDLQARLRAHHGFDL